MKKKINWSKIKQLIKENKWLILILLIAVFLRLYRIGSYMEFLGDQGRDVVVIRRFLTKGDLMFIGPQTSIGNMYLAPWYYYLIAPALLISFFNPIGPAIMVALLSVLTVWLAYKIGRQWFDKKTGLIAALFLALSPVVIYYSIFSWNPNVMPFFSLVSLWLTYLVWQKKDYQKLPLLAVSLAMVLNSHYLGLLLFPALAVFWLLSLREIKKKKEKKVFWQKSFLAVIVFLVLMSPLLLFDLKHDFANFNAFKTFFSVRQTTVNLKFYKGFLNLPLIVDQLWANLVVRQDSWAGSFWLFFFLLLGIYRLRKNKAVWLLSAVLLIGLLGLANYKQHVYAHYFAFLWPAAALLLGAAVKKLYPYSLPVLILLPILMVLNWHGFSPPVNQLERAEKVAQFIIDQSGGEEFSLALIAEMNYDPPYRYFLDLKKAPLVDLHEKIPEQLFVICEPWGKVDCQPINHPEWAIAAFGWAKIESEWQVEGVKLFKLIHNK